MQLNSPAHARIPGNRSVPSRDSKVVDRHALYPRAQSQSILDRFESYLDQHALSPATVRNYLADLRAFARWHAIRKAHPQTFTAADFRAYREHLCNETNHSPATVNRRLQSLRLFGRFLHEMGHSADNPTREIQLLRNGNGYHPAPRTLSLSEVSRLTEAISAGRASHAQRDYAILQLMLHAGLRVHEVAALRLGDVIATRRGTSIEVRSDQRNGRERIVPLNTPAARALSEYLPTRPAIPRLEHVFLSQRGQPLSTRSIQRVVGEHARAAGLQGVSAQLLRHTCAKNMLQEMRNTALVARWLGCRNAKSLERYAA